MEAEGLLPHSQELPPTLILSQINPLHAPHPTSWRSILLLSFHLLLDLPNSLVSSGLSPPPTTLYASLLFPVYVTCPAHVIVHDLITRMMFGKEYISLKLPMCSLLHSPVTSSLLDPNNFLSPLSSNALSLRFSVSVDDQVSHPYKTNGN